MLYSCHSHQNKSSTTCDFSPVSCVAKISTQLLLRDCRRIHSSDFLCRTLVRTILLITIFPILYCIISISEELNIFTIYILELRGTESTTMLGNIYHYDRSAIERIERFASRNFCPIPFKDMQIYVFPPFLLVTNQRNIQFQHKKWYKLPIACKGIRVLKTMLRLIYCSFSTAYFLFSNSIYKAVNAAKKPNNTPGALARASGKSRFSLNNP